MCKCIVCTHVHVCLSVCVCAPAQAVLEAVSLLGRLGCAWPESHCSLIMPDRLIRGASCCVSITTDKASMPPLNLSLHTGTEGLQAGAGEEGPGMEGE